VRFAEAEAVGLVVCQWGEDTYSVFCPEGGNVNVTLEQIIAVCPIKIEAPFIGWVRIARPTPPVAPSPPKL
jgi:hypothetical protein